MCLSPIARGSGCHGGGYVNGPAPMILSRKAIRSRAGGFSVDYRMAPEHRAPRLLPGNVCAVIRRGGEKSQAAQDASSAGPSAGGGLAASRRAAQS